MYHYQEWLAWKGKKGEKERPTQFPSILLPPPLPRPLPTSFNTFTVRKIYGDMSMEDKREFSLWVKSYSVTAKIIASKPQSPGGSNVG